MVFTNDGIVRGFVFCFQYISVQKKNITRRINTMFTIVFKHYIVLL